MFGGLITSLGVVEVADGGKFSVRCPGGFLDSAIAGASVAVDGVCLTATAIENDGELFCADLSAETILRCAPWQSGQKVHLEKPLCIGDEVGGHFVSGHIDGVATITLAQADNTGGAILQITPPKKLAMLIAEKGSVALAGVSLTIGEVWDNANGECVFAVHIVPHTLQATTIKEWQKGDKVNMEADMLARYCARYFADKNETLH